MVHDTPVRLAAQEPHTSAEPSAAVMTMLREAVRFACWAAGEGLCPVDGEDAESPEDFLFAYSQATGDEEWETLPGRLNELLAPLLADAGREADAPLTPVAADPGGKQ